jgi:hypothetical protein
MTLTVGDAASIATAFGAALAVIQLWLGRRQAKTQFEDQLSAQYRSLIRDIPISAVLGEDLDEASYQTALPVFYHYFDLCNEQAFLRKRRRIRHSTWRDWRDGIETNLKRPMFRRAWSEIARRSPESFDELRRVVPPAPISGVAL